MLAIRRANERGHANHGWLDTHYTFSFADYHDPRFMGFRSLRVINEDRVAPGMGFGTHPHRDMEIVTFVIEGALAHRDSLGTGSTIEPGELQRITAGTGITHSEFNASQTDQVHLYQIWLLPERRGLTPSYEQKAFAPSPGSTLLASPNGEGGSLLIHQDVRLSLVDLKPGARFDQPIAAGRYAWLQVVNGRFQLGDEILEAGDGVAISDESALTCLAETDARALFFDLN